MIGRWLLWRVTAVVPLVWATLVSTALLAGCGGAAAPIAYQRLGRGLPDLTIFDEEGNDQQLADTVSGPAVVHVFASWCAACRWELAGLMQLESETRIPVVALGMDPSFRRIRSLFDGEMPDDVYRVDENDVRRELGVSSLPQSFLVDARGNLRGRLAGARDWSDDDLRALVRRELGVAE